MQKRVAVFLFICCLVGVTALAQAAGHSTDKAAAPDAGSASS